jgi:hypothetical protein
VLAARRAIKSGNTELERTPLLLPSFSSKGFPKVAKILETTREVISGPILVSAYDLHVDHQNISPPFDFASMVFLDSGGYEASKETELSDYGEVEHTPGKWTQEMQEAVLAGWKSSVPTVVIGYDHPKSRLPVAEQIQRARGVAAGRTDVLREILLKPETEDQRYLKVDSVVQNIRALSEFDVIGVTEKEVGRSIFQRMENIAKIRLALTRIGLETPIHVFGSLDTLTSPLYFVAGADIFDGLTWLRFAFKDGNTLYKQNYGALEFGIKTAWDVVDGRTWFDNYRYLSDLELEMRRFLRDEDFASFKHHGDLIHNAYFSVVESVGA